MAITKCHYAISLLHRLLSGGFADANHDDVYFHVNYLIQECFVHAQNSDFGFEPLVGLIFENGYRTSLADIYAGYNMTTCVDVQALEQQFRIVGIWRELELPDLEIGIYDKLFHLSCVVSKYAIELSDKYIRYRCKTRSRFNFSSQFEDALEVVAIKGPHTETRPELLTILYELLDLKDYVKEDYEAKEFARFKFITDEHWYTRTINECIKLLTGKGFIRRMFTKTPEVGIVRMNNQVSSEDAIISSIIDSMETREF